MGGLGELLEKWEKITLTPAQRLQATTLYFLEQAASAMPVMHLASTLLLDATR